MINKNFYPTPEPVIEMMLHGINLQGKYVCEPSGGKGDIVDYVKKLGAENVCSYEIEKELVKILSTKCTVLGNDWLEAEAKDISHVDYIIMNPPFDQAHKHISHAFDIAPEGCEIIAICNAKTVRESDDWDERKNIYKSELVTLIKNYGTPIQFIEDAFKVSSGAERGTSVEIALFKLFKPGYSKDFDYEGFYMEEEPEYTENGIVAFSEIRNIVGRYIASLRAFDEMSDKMSTLRENARSVGLSGTYSLHLSSNENIVTKQEFLKSLQKAAWQSVFQRMNMDKLVTSGVKEKLNKFVETQHKVPFTVKNVHHMINMIVATYKQNMDESMVTVFDHLTKRYHENRYNVEGWKTNEAHCIGKKFILPNEVKVGYSGRIEANGWDNYDKLTDLQKAMCYLTGKRYEYESLYSFFSRKMVKKEFNPTEEDIKEQEERIRTYLRNNPLEDWSEAKIKRRALEVIHKKEMEGIEVPEYKEFGQWYDFGFFMVKGFKKGTLHCKFKDEKEWEMLNRAVNEIKGYPLPEKI